MFVALLLLLISVLMIILLDLKDKLAQMKKVVAAKEREIHDMEVVLDRYRSSADFILQSG